MSEEGPIEKAESLVKRLLERLGSTVDVKLSSAEREKGLSLTEIGRLSSMIEDSIETGLRRDNSTSTPVAPNQFKILFTYEQRSRLSDGYVQALGQELKATASDFIVNRRYQPAGPIILEIGSDLFSKSTRVRAGFSDDRAADSDTQDEPGNPSAPGGTKEIEFLRPGGHRYRLLCAPDVPLYLGRAAGCSVHIDDPSISRLHCSIMLKAGREIVLSDLGSSNGTSVNGRVVSSGEARAIEHGDIIQVGDVKLEVA